MPKVNRTPAKILSNKNIKGNNRTVASISSSAGSQSTGLKVQSKEIIEVDYIENENNLDLNGAEVIHGEATQNGDIVIANAQSSIAESDIYVVSETGDWSVIENDLSKVELILVKSGTKYANNIYRIKDGTSRESQNLEFIQVYNADVTFKHKRKVLSVAELQSLHFQPITLIEERTGSRVLVHNLRLGGLNGLFFCLTALGNMFFSLTDGTTDVSINTVSGGELVSAFSDTHRSINTINRTFTGETSLEVYTNGALQQDPSSVNLVIDVYYSYLEF